MSCRHYNFRCGNLFENISGSTPTSSSTNYHSNSNIYIQNLKSHEKGSHYLNLYSNQLIVIDGVSALVESEILQKAPHGWRRYALEHLGELRVAHAEGEANNGVTERKFLHFTLPSFIYFHLFVCCVCC